MKKTFFLLLLLVVPFFINAQILEKPTLSKDKRTNIVNGVLNDSIKGSTKSTSNDKLKNADAKLVIIK